MSVEDLETEVLRLRRELQKKEDELMKLKEKNSSKNIQEWDAGVPKWAVERYSRQVLVTELGPPLPVLRALHAASVLIVGAGGLGCPASAYLAGAGIGHIGILDYDEVEETNIHRQLLHSEVTVGLDKVVSAVIALRRINSTIRITPHHMQLDSTNALEVLRMYDVVLDCTDNVVTRYLLNDACVLLGKPLVSASALRLEGQLTVYNYKTEDVEGPCMRCIFPLPPPAETIGSCSQSGVLGPIPGTLGTLQALECIKLLLGKLPLAGSMLLVDGADCSFRKVKLRGRNPSCAVCSSNPTITQLIDYQVFCNARASDKDLKLDVLKPEERIIATDFNTKIYQDIVATTIQDVTNLKSNDSDFKNWNEKTLLIDVRSAGEFEMCRIDGFRNVPFERFENVCNDIATSAMKNQTKEVYIICRRGNDSQTAVRILKQALGQDVASSSLPRVADVEGGLHSWARTVDEKFPIY